MYLGTKLTLVFDPRLPFVFSGAFKFAHVNSIPSSSYRHSRWSVDRARLQLRSLH